MTLELFIEHYGYWTVLIGTFLEGETVLVLAGFLAHRGYLFLPWVVAAAFAGSFCGDQLFFHIGRKYGGSYLAKHPAWQKKSSRARRLLEEYKIPFIIGFRFFYGMRTITPFMIGMSGVGRVQFVMLNLLGAMAWAIAVGTGGYFFGSTLEYFFNDVKRYERVVLGLIVITGLLLWFFHFMRSRKGGGKREKDSGMSAKEP